MYIYFKTDPITTSSKEEALGRSARLLPQAKYRYIYVYIIYRVELFECVFQRHLAAYGITLWISIMVYVLAEVMKITAPIIRNTAQCPFEQEKTKSKKYSISSVPYCNLRPAQCSVSVSDSVRQCQTLSQCHTVAGNVRVVSDSVRQCLGWQSRRKCLNQWPGHIALCQPQVTIGN